MLARWSIQRMGCIVEKREFFMDIDRRFDFHSQNLFDEFKQFY